MNRPTIQRPSMPQLWPHQYPNVAHPDQPRPSATPYSLHPQNSYPAPALYPNVAGQQHPQRYSQPPVPDTLARPRSRSTAGDNNPFFESQPPVPQFPSFPSPSPAQFPHGSPFPPIPAYPPASQHQSSGYPMPATRRTQDELPIRPAPISARRSTSSPVIDRIATSDGFRPSLQNTTRVTVNTPPPTCFPSTTPTINPDSIT